MASKGKKQPFVPDFGGGEISIDELMLVGNSYIEMLKYEEAKECYRQAFLMQPENAELYRVLNDLEKHMSLWMLPNRVIVKIGKIKIQIAFLVLLFALAAIGQEKLFTVAAVIYLIVLVYSHTAGKVYDLFMKNRK